MASLKDGRHLLSSTQPGSPQAEGLSAPLHHHQVRLPSLRKRLNLALTGREVTLVIMDKDAGFKIDNKVRRDARFPVGVMDVLTVAKTN